MMRSPYNPLELRGGRTCAQRGAILPLFVIALIAMLGLVGLALDGGHAMLNKTRLQNAVDASALSAAKVLDETGDVVLAEAEAIATFDRNASNPGNAEMAASWAGGDLTLSVQFSNTLHPFVPGTVPAQYVRVRANTLRLPGWFIPVLGFNEKLVGASAVAGPSPMMLEAACNVAPMMVCGDPNAEENYGYTLNQATVLKSSTSDFEVGPGNFQLIRLDGGQGAQNVRSALAGGFEICMQSNEPIETEPGNAAGPVAQGLNTRFGEYQGPMHGGPSVYPPDTNVRQPEPPLTYNDGVIYYNSQPIGSDPLDYDFYDYEDYDNPADHTRDDGIRGRRVLAVPVGDCSTTVNGQGTIETLGFLCYFLVQRASQQGNNSHVFGQFVESCSITGRPGPDPGTGTGPYVIQLYKDETAEAS